ncbi:C-type lectin domain family 2 member D-like, partial [Protobothrops mucrosquamatus]|uniref:C-type lectin domain family 2 member D-like n=1 Tax=Protobothrops mucrosquamatus TaxID=103944 RepID=UPI000775626B
NCKDATIAGKPLKEGLQGGAGAYKHHCALAKGTLVSKRIPVKKIIIGAVIVLVVVLIITIILLAVKKPKTCSHCPSLPSQSVVCPDSWIGYRGKCFYVSKEEKNWSLSLTTCSSFNASLAVIDTQKELDFWVDILNPFHYWFDLSREANKVWKWSNGTEFKTRFPVRGEGLCAYIDANGASSTICSMEKNFLCSHPESYSKAG